MIEFLTSMTSLKVFLLTLLVFGFAPGAVIRLLTLVYHRDDPRRQEMRAELYAVPRVKRPLWVAEQLEVVAFEGLPDRVRDVLAGRVTWRWSLGDGVESNRLYPETFEIPSDEDKALVTTGTIVKLMFRLKDGTGERMWVCVEKATSKGFVGTLRNDPVFIPRLEFGDRVKFGLDAIIDLDPDTLLPGSQVIDAAE